QPSAIRIRTVSPPSFSSLPRSGTIISPSATWRTTGWPIHALNALSILSTPQNFSVTERESRREVRLTMVHRGYGTSKFVLFHSGWLNQEEVLWKYIRTVLKGRAGHSSKRGPLAFCRNEAEGPFRAGEDDPEYREAVRAARHWTGPGRRLCPRICAPWRPESPSAASHSHLSYSRQQ